MSTDDELLAAWRAGDRAAGDELVSRHFDALCRFFRSKVGRGIEDLVQRTFLDCLESLESVRGPSFRAYLFGVARNRLIDELRRTLGAGEVVDIESEPIASMATSPSKAVARTQQERLLLQAMQELPLDLQITLELAYWEGLSGREIAAILQIPENTVRSRLTRARDKLRAQLEALASSPELLTATLSVLERRARGSAPL